MRDMQINGKGLTMLRNVGSGPGTTLEAPPDEHEGQYALPVKELLEVLWRRLWVIVLVAVVLTVLVVSFDWLQPPTYEASIKVLIGQEPVGKRGLDNLNDIASLQDFTQTAAEVLPTRTVAEAAIQRLDPRTTPEDLDPEDLDPEDILGGLNAEPAQDTLVIDVSYTDPDPEGAQQIVNAVGAGFSDQISEISPDPGVTAKVWEEAELPDSPISPNPFRDGLAALVLGGLLGVGLAFLLERLDDRWRSPEEVERVSGVPNFGVVRRFEMSKGAKKEGRD